MQFSDPLAKGKIDFANYVTVNGEKPASVRAQGSQLCVEDLLHGKRYEVKVRSGIPSTEGDQLPKPIELTVYIRDRSPSVRILGRNYVLPKTGQQGIPVISINTKLVKATIYRIGDRRLAAEVLDGDFEKQLQAYELKQIADQKGEKLWSGEMPVVSKLNEEVTTAFPVDTLLPNLKPGLYVIAASAADEAVKPAGDADAEAEGRGLQHQGHAMVCRFRSRAHGFFGRGRRACLCALAGHGGACPGRGNPPGRAQ